MGAKVIGMSHNDKKKEVAKELGCDDYINTNNEADMAKYKKKLTHILCTGNGRDFKCMLSCILYMSLQLLTLANC